jgi:hypothetical protein
LASPRRLIVFSYFDLARECLPGFPSSVFDAQYSIKES